MTEIERKALAWVNEVEVERGLCRSTNLDCNLSSHEALCRAVEAHEAFRQEVSDAVLGYFEGGLPEEAVAFFHRFITAKPDPLMEALVVEALVEAFPISFDEYPMSSDDMANFREALAARGLEVVEKK